MMKKGIRVTGVRGVRRAEASGGKQISRGETEKGMIRAALPKDLPSITRLLRHTQALHAKNVPWLFKEPSAHAQYGAWFAAELESPKSLVLVAENAGSVVGYLYAKEEESEESWIRPSLHYFLLHHLAVEPDHQRRGFGAKLMKELFKEAGIRGIRRIELDVWDFNDKARRFFAKSGFRAFNHRMDLRLDRSSSQTRGASA